MKIDNTRLVHLGRVPRDDDGGEFRIDLGTVKGLPSIIIRRFEASRNNRPHPTSEAIAFDVNLLPMIRHCLDKGEKVAREINLIQEAA